MGSNNRISAVVVTHKKGELLKKTLLLLLAQIEPIDEIIVIDDGCFDWRFVPRDRRIYYCPVRHKGFRLSRLSNIGIQLAQGEVVTKLDGDTYPKPGFIESLRAYTKPGVLVVTSVDWEDGNKIHPDFRFSNNYYKKELLFSSDGNVNYPQLTWGSGIAMTKEDWIRCGGFDESIECWGGEESDLGWRCYYMGIQHFCIPNTGVVHQFHHREANKTDIKVNTNQRFLLPLKKPEELVEPHSLSTRLMRSLFAIGRTEECKYVYYEQYPKNPSRWIREGPSSGPYLEFLSGRGAVSMCHISAMDPE